MKEIIKFNKTTFEIKVDKSTNNLKTIVLSSVKSPLTIATQVLKKVSHSANKLSSKVYVIL